MIQFARTEFDHAFRSHLGALLWQQNEDGKMVLNPSSDLAFLVSLLLLI